MKENGDVDLEVVRSKIPPGVPQEEADRLINKCKDISKFQHQLDQIKPLFAMTSTITMYIP